MRSPWLTLTLALTLTWTRTSARCPDACRCGTGDELEYTCELAGGNVSITARIRDYFNIDCEGGALTCSDFPSIPIAGNRSLPSLYIRECSLPDPLACIARRLEATGVDLLMLRNVSTPLERWHVEGLASEKLYMFTAEAQTTIPSEALSSLPSLRYFRLCGGDVTLTGQDFRRAPPLSYLELATDHVTAIPADAFQGLGQLKKLNVWGNNISEIHEDALKGLSSLEALYISSDRVRSLPSRLLTHSPALTTLTLERNFISTLPSELFRGLSQLKQVTISNDAPLTLEPLSFANLSLTSLKLDQASLSALPPSLLLNCSSLVNLTLTHNKIQHIPDIFEGLISLERLDLSYNRITNISNRLFLGLKALRELKMDANLLEELPEQLFSGLRHLESLSMNSNRLHSIHPDAFQGASLLHLSLSRNQLTLATPSGGYDYLEKYSPFNNQQKLRTLTLSGNRISIMFFDWRNVLLDLMELDLKYNSFKELTQPDVQFLSSQITVDLRYNNISTIFLTPAYPRSHDLDPYETSASILLDGNPLHCDCRLYTLAKRLRGDRPLTVEPSLLLDETKCVSPPSLQGIEFRKIPLDEFVCDVECSCQCQIRPYIDALDLICNNGSNIPDPNEYGLSHSILKLRHMPKDLNLPDYVSVLNLTNLGLKTVPEVPKSLELVDLTNNKLEDFPVKLISMNISLKLSGNMFVCDCSTVKEIALMNKYHSKIIDWQTVKCKDGSYLWRLDVEKLCLVQRATILGSVLATIGLILAILAVIMHRYSVEIRIFLSNRGLCCFVDEYDATKKYDVFVSFAHDDEVFVIEKLLPKLEINYKVCVHHRDWRVGDLIPTQIARSVEESRRTLIVLSRNFLASTWGMLEFRAAHVQAARERKVRVVVLLLEDISDVEIDSELRAYLTTNTYIKWGDQWFWEKLQYALPKRAKAEDVRSEKRAQIAADNMAKGGLQVSLTPDGKLVNTAMNKNVI